MIRINENYTKLKASYLFADIARRVAAFTEANPGKPVIRLGIGDVTEPLPPACVAALHAAADEMASRATFRGYGPEQGYPFLRELVAQRDYAQRGCRIEPDEVFISDGSKCDCGNIQEIFADDIRLAIPDPVYPVYVDTNVMAGRTGPSEGGRYQGILYLDSTALNGYVPDVPAEPADLVYLCFPNNPTGAVARLRQAQQGRHPLRLGLRGVHPRPVGPALDLRDRGRARRRNRVPQLLEDRRVHGDALRLHGGA
jgi:LL-diaminopimelate aminotransferase